MSAGITISKRRNRLKGDIVEALQCLKMSMRNELFWRQSGPSSLFEVSLEDADDSDDEKNETEGEDVTAIEQQSWDEVMLIEDESDLDD